MTETQSNAWLLLAFIIGCGWLLYALTPILTPFALSAGLAYLGDPLVDRLERIRIGRFGIGRTGGVLVVFTLIFGVLLLLPMLLLPSLEAQISRLIENLPRYAEWIRTTALPMVMNALNMDAQFEASGLVDILKEHWQEAGGLAANILGSLSSSGAVVFAWIMNMLLVPVVTFYLLRDWDRLVEAIHGLLPRQHEAKISTIARESDQVLSAFFRGQLMVMLVLAVFYSVALALIGLDLALLVGIIAGLVSFVPYLGAIVGLLMAGIAAAVQFQDIFHVALALGVFFAGQALEGMVLTPKLVGDQIGLHPVAVIFAVLAGGQLFGFIGVLLALPASAVVMVILRHIHQGYLNSGMYDEPGKIVTDTGTHKAVVKPPQSEP